MSIGSKIFLLLAALAAPAAAEESSYCKKVRARALADASLLFAPSLQAQGIKFPNNGTTDSGITTGAGYQFRAALAFSPLDIYKGARVLRVGEADCRQHDAVERVQAQLMQAADVGRLPALRRQAQFLDAHRADWDAIVAKSEERLAAHVTPLADALELRSRRADLERLRVQIAGEIERLELRGADGAPSLAELGAVERTAMRYEREVSHVRNLDAWSVTLTGGIIPQVQFDYFAMVQVGFNFGAFGRVHHESRYLAARAEELHTARYELADEVRKLNAQIESSRGQAIRELAIVDAQLASLADSRAALAAHLDAPGAPHALAAVELEMISVAANRAFLAGLVDALVHLQEIDHGR